MLVLPATSAGAMAWHRHYYDNYFKSFFTCIARGEGAIGHRNDDQRINGALSYVCYKAPGQRKYSMDVLFRGNGGGGGGSWKIGG
jgi:hypothetical protein